MNDRKIITKEQRDKYTTEFYNKCMTLLKKKGNDYTYKEDAFKDIIDTAIDIRIHPKKVLWIYAKKHLAAIKRYIREGTLESEPIEERLMDFCNYLAIIYVFNKITEKKGKKKS